MIFRDVFEMTRRISHEPGAGQLDDLLLSMCMGKHHLLVTLPWLLLLRNLVEVMSIPVHRCPSNLSLFHASCVPTSMTQFPPGPDFVASNTTTQLSTAGVDGCSLIINMTKLIGNTSKEESILLPCVAGYERNKAQNGDAFFSCTGFVSAVESNSSTIKSRSFFYTLEGRWSDGSTTEMLVHGTSSRSGVVESHTDSCFLRGVDGDDVADDDDEVDDKIDDDTDDTNDKFNDKDDDTNQDNKCLSLVCGSGRHCELCRVPLANGTVTTLPSCLPDGALC